MLTVGKRVSDALVSGPLVCTELFAKEAQFVLCVSSGHPLIQAYRMRHYSYVLYTIWGSQLVHQVDASAR